MATWVEANTQAAVLAAELHADLAIDLTRPVDVFDSVRRLGIVLAFAPLGRVSGLYIPAGRTPGILLHSGHPRTRQRYTAAHELGHHQFGHQAEVDEDLEALTRSDVERWPDREKEAEAFGAWFLMPRRLIRVGMERLGMEVPRDPVDVYALSLWLGTSYTATARQLGATRICPRDDVDQWVRVAPRQVKTMLAGEMVPDDLRHDVWWLDDRSHDRDVDTRPGDRLVLTLNEIPSSGFVWEVQHLPPGVSVLADSSVDSWEPELLRTSSDAAVDFAGAAHYRALLLEVDAEAGATTGTLSLVKRRPWLADSSPMERFDLMIAVRPSLHGLQIDERDLALTR